MEVQMHLVASGKICINISHKVIILDTIMLIISINININHICCYSGGCNFSSLHEAQVFRNPTICPIQ